MPRRNWVWIARDDYDSLLIYPLAKPKPKYNEDHAEFKQAGQAGSGAAEFCYNDWLKLTGIHIEEKVLHKMRFTLEIIG